jgi:magnesium chelatase family protein
LEKETKSEKVVLETKPLKRFRCATLDFNEAKEVEVESAFVRALPGFSIVGIASQAIQESKERIKSALTSLGFKYPAQKITISLSPSDLKKEGSHFDLGIALLVYLQKSNIDLEKYYIFGELGLDGSVKDTNHIFPILLSLASKKESLYAIIPASAYEKISQIPNIKAFAVEHIQECIDFFQGEKELKNFTCKLAYKSIQLHEKKYYYKDEFPLDFKDVKGQNRLKRMLVIAATGMHNILLEGSPGCGKSMSIKRLRYILPPMGIEEILQTNAYNAISGENSTLEPIRPFRSPHHTSSKPSIFGGGSTKAMAGECALAHNGILFFDEFPHFSKSVLESLREPLEDNQVLISRVNSKIKYETKFLFAAAQNPCPCGNLLSSTKECRCSELEIKRYKNRISEPILDRIDIYFQVPQEYNEQEDLSSTEMFEQVLKGFSFLHVRGQESFNAKLEEAQIDKFCILDKKAQGILEKAIERYGLNYRSVAKIKKLARTIADLEQSNLIQSEHIFEALQYRAH